MLESKYLIFVALAMVVVWWELCGKGDRSVALITFLASSSALIYRDFGLFISVAGLLVFIAWAARLMRARRSLSLAMAFPPSALFLVISVTLVGLSAALFGDTLPSVTGDLFGELVSVSLFPIVALLYYGLVNECGKSERGRIIIYSFILSALLHLGAVMVQAAGFQHAMPAFVVSSTATVDESQNALDLIERFGGLMGDYELIVDFAVMVLAASAVLLIRGESRLLALAGIFSATLIGIYSGTRSFVVTLAVAFAGVIAVSTVILRSRRTRRRVWIVATLGVVGATCAWLALADSILVFERLQVALKLLSTGGLESALNRNYSATLELILRDVPVVGLGPYLISEFHGNEIVSHNVFFAAYSRYGVLGVITLIVLVGIALRSVTLALLRAKTDGDRLILTVLGVFTVALLAQQFKVSALRSTAGMMIYSFWFALLFVSSRQGVSRNWLSKREC